MLFKPFKLPSDSALTSFAESWQSIGGHEIDSIGLEEDFIDSWLADRYATESETQELSDYVYNKYAELGIEAEV